MAEINAKDVMRLRNETGLPMMKCKEALATTDGDFEAAKEHLRKTLKGKMDEKLDRAAGEGRVELSVADDRATGVLVELKAETDFTAKNDKFIAAAKSIAAEALNASGIGTVEATDAMKAAADDIRIATGENISIGRVERLGGEGRTVGGYVHHDGKTAALVVVEGSADEETLRRIGMHITAAVPRPMGVTPDDIPAEAVEKERKFRLDQAVESGKPEEIAQKIVEGGMKKFYSDVALNEQEFVMDPSVRVKDLVKDGKIVDFRRWQIGEAG